MVTDAVKFTQNFLTNKQLVQKLIKSAQIKPNDLVLDIGAGEGILTEALLNHGCRVIAIELDSRLVSLMSNKFKNKDNLSLVNKDFRKYDLPNQPYKVFSNIPFNLSSDIINKLLFNKNSPEIVYLIVQKEVAMRYMGIGEGYLLSLLIRPLYNIRITHKFSRADFMPVPKVDSVMLELTKLKITLVIDKDIPLYNDFISYVVTQQKPSLMLRLNRIFTKEQFLRLSSSYNFSLDSTVKDLSFPQWLGLFNYFKTRVIKSKQQLVYGATYKYFINKDKQKKTRRTRRTVK